MHFIYDACEGNCKLETNVTMKENIFAKVAFMFRNITEKDTVNK